MLLLRKMIIWSVQDEIIKRFCFVKIIIVTGRTFTDAVNEIPEVACDDNMTYCVRIDDDAIFISLNWASTGMYTRKCGCCWSNIYTCK